MVLPVCAYFTEIVFASMNCHFFPFVHFSLFLPLLSCPTHFARLVLNDRFFLYDKCCKECRIDDDLTSV